MVTLEKRYTLVTFTTLADGAPVTQLSDYRPVIQEPLVLSAVNESPEKPDRMLEGEQGK